MGQEQQTPSYDRDSEMSRTDKDAMAALRAENERLKTLVIELTAIIARSVLDRR